MTPAQALKIQAWKAKQLDDLIRETADFDNDEYINGADFVAFFDEWRQGIKEKLEELTHENQ